MTKTIEFIEKEILICNQNIDFQMQIAFESQENKFKKKYHENEALKLTEKLQMLQQIKCELEAWEVVKKYCKEKSINGIVFEHIINVSHTKQNYEIVKKALEVEDE